MHHRAARVLAIAGAALVVAGLAGSAAPNSSPPREGGRGRATAAVAAAPFRPGPPPRPQPRPRPRPQPSPAVPEPTLIATLRAPTPYRASPDAGAPVTGTLPATNPFGSAQVLAVLGSPTPAGWLHVELPVRPNGTRGWIRTTGASLSQTSYHVFVSVSARTVTVTNRGRPVLTVSAAVGKPSTPTPPGQTYLWELIRPDDPEGAYGPFIFGLGWFSDSYAVFNGGDAQIGIHGQDAPWSLGQPVSHGCVRLANPVITRLAGLLPLGTPVTIS